MVAVTWSYTCFGDALSLLFGRSMSELGLKDDERGGPRPEAEWSFFAVDSVFVLRIWGKEHLWSSILEPWKCIRPAFLSILDNKAHFFNTYCKYLRHIK